MKYKLTLTDDELDFEQSFNFQNSDKIYEALSEAVEYTTEKVGFIRAKQIFIKELQSDPDFAHIKSLSDLKQNELLKVCSQRMIGNFNISLEYKSIDEGKEWMCQIDLHLAHELDALREKFYN